VNYGEDMSCITCGQWLGPYGECGDQGRVCPESPAKEFGTPGAQLLDEDGDPIPYNLYAENREID
jgi:hypothetical protein